MARNKPGSIGEVAGEPIPEDVVAEHFKSAPPSRKRRRRPTLPFRIFLVLLAIGLVAGLGSYIYYKRWLANPSNVKALAIAKIGLLFPGKKVTVGSASFSIFRGLDFYNVAVSELDTGASIARLEHVHIDFDLAKLRSLALEPRNVRARGLFVDLVRYPDGKWNLPIPTSSAAPKTRLQLALPFTLAIDDAFVSLDDRLNAYSISCPVDSVVAMTDARSVSLWHMSMAFGGGLLGKWRLNARGDADARVMEAQFAVADIDLGQGFENRLPPEARNVYKKFKPGGLADVKGTVSYSDEKRWGFDVNAALKGCQVTFYRFPVTVTDLAGTATLDTQGFKFANLQGEIGDGSVIISGEGGFGKDASLSIVAATKDIIVTDELLAAMPDRAGVSLKRFNPSGPIDAVARFDRESGPGKHVEIAVECDLKGISAKYDVFPVAVDDVRGHITFAGGNVLVDNLIAKRRASPVIISGKVTNVLHDPAIDMRVAVKGVDLDDEIMRALPNKGQSVWKSLAVGGKADVAASISRLPKTNTTVSFVADLQGVNANYEKVPYAVDSGKGQVVFRDGVFTFSNLYFRHRGARIAVSGSAGIKTGDMRLDFKATNLALDEDLRAAMPEKVRAHFDRLGISGYASADVSVARAPDGKITFGDVNAVLAKGQFSEPTLPIGVGNASGRVLYSNDAITISDLKGSAFTDNVSGLLPVMRLASLALAQSDIAIGGRISLHQPRSAWKFDFQAGRLAVNDAFEQKMPAAVEKMLSERGARGAIDLGGEIAYGVNDSKPRVDYALKVKSYESAIKLAKPVDGVVGDVDLSGQWTAGANAFSATGRLNELRFARRDLNNTSFELSTNGRETMLQSFRANVYGGTVSGQSQVGHAVGSGYGLVLDLSGISLSELLSRELGYTKKDLQGKVSGQVQILAQGDGVKDFIGSAEVNVTEGTLWEVPFVFELMNVLSLRLPERTQFDKAHIKCNIVNGRILVDEFSMSSSPATILGKGVIGLDGTLDLTFYSRPGQIPIVSLLAGEVGRQLVVARATGTFSKPVVILVPSGIVGHALDWLKRRFTQ